MAQAGSEPAFAAIVGRYRDPLRGYCRRLIGDERADDVVQQTFLVAYAALAGGETVLRLRPWLYRVAHNAALNALRDRFPLHEQLDEGVLGGRSSDQTVESRERFGQVLAAMRALPARQRDAMVLRELEGRSYADIASRLGVSRGAVRQLLNRARNAIRGAVVAASPIGALLRLLGGLDAPGAARVAGLCGAVGGSAAVAVKLCSSALVGGALVGGVTGAGPAPAVAHHRTQRPAVRVTFASCPCPSSHTPDSAGREAADRGTAWSGLLPHPALRAPSSGSGGRRDGALVAFTGDHRVRATDARRERQQSGPPGVGPGGNSVPEARPPALRGRDGFDGGRPEPALREQQGVQLPGRRSLLAAKRQPVGMGLGPVPGPHVRSGEERRGGRLDPVQRDRPA